MPCFVIDVLLVTSFNVLSRFFFVSRILICGSSHFWSDKLCDTASVSMQPWQRTTTLSLKKWMRVLPYTLICQCRRILLETVKDSIHFQKRRGNLQPCVVILYYNVAGLWSFKSAVGSRAVDVKEMYSDWCSSGFLFTMFYNTTVVVVVELVEASYVI